MALALIKVKIMPDSPDTNLAEIEKKAIEIFESAGSKRIKFEKEPIAFGIVAIIILFSWDDTESNDELMKKIQTIPNVSSAEIIDYRRAIG